MKRTLLSLLLLGLFAGVGSPAMAQNVTANTQPNAEPDRVAMSEEVAKIDAAKRSEEYRAAKARAQTDYTDSKAKCKDLKGGDALTCVKGAKAARTEALAQAKIQRDNPGETSDAIEEDAGRKPGNTSHLPLKPRGTRTE
ncbi:MAG: hypothetical protein ABI604_12835 [Nitrospirota bacterium]